MRKQWKLLKENRHVRHENSSGNCLLLFSNLFFSRFATVIALFDLHFTKQEKQKAAAKSQVSDSMENQQNWVATFSRFFLRNRGSKNFGQLFLFFAAHGGWNSPENITITFRVIHERRCGVLVTQTCFDTLSGKFLTKKNRNDAHKSLQIDILMNGFFWQSRWEIV